MRMRRRECDARQMLPKESQRVVPSFHKGGVGVVRVTKCYICVKSGTLTGMLPFSSERRESSLRQHHSARS